MKPKKIFILIPDGVGLRNFAFTTYVEIGKKNGWDIIFWNQTPFDLTALGYKEIKLNGKSRAITDLYKRAKIDSELNYFSEKFEDLVFQEYKFKNRTTGIKNTIKNILVKKLTKYYSGAKSLERLRTKMQNSERGNELYKECKKTLFQEQPDFVFCTNQRPIKALAPLLAANDLGIPTAAFIFSWDNLPKATMVVNTDYYFVWSDYMKNELLKYYPQIQNSQIKITGTPQFEVHFLEKTKIEKEKFYQDFNLESKRHYLCYSGDDITTAPHDELYLLHTAKAVSKMNSEGYNLGIIFRRSPVDLSKRYDPILAEYKDIIVPIEPLWEKISDSWDAILPTKQDLKLQSNIIQHTFMVVNVASSMVFDYISYGKPCAYIHYNPTEIEWIKDTRSIYRYIHFRSMPSKNSALWINDVGEIESVIKAGLEQDISEVIKNTKKWFEIINQHPVLNANERIWSAIEEII